MIRAVKRDLVAHHNITYLLTRDGSCFYAMTLTFDLMIFNIGRQSALSQPPQPLSRNLRTGHVTEVSLLDLLLRFWIVDFV